MSDLGAYRFGQKVHKALEDRIRGKFVSVPGGMTKVYEMAIEHIRSNFDEVYIEPRIDNIRPDVIAISKKDNLLVIYDFKTGTLTEENRDRIKKQLKKYLNTISLIPQWKDYEKRALVIFKDRIIDYRDL